MISTRTEIATPAAVEERDARDGQAEDRDHDRAAREDDGTAGGRDGPADRLLDRSSRRRGLAVPGDEEQGVVDPDAEPDHAPNCGAQLGMSIR